MLSLDFTVILQLVVFLAFFVAVNQTLLKPVIRSLDERDAKVEGQKVEARRLKRDAEERQHKFQETMRVERERAVQKRDALRAEGRALEQRILEKTRGEAGERSQAAFKKLAEQRTTQSAVLKKDAQAMAQLIVEKVLGRAA